MTEIPKGTSVLAPPALRAAQATTSSTTSGNGQRTSQEFSFGLGNFHSPEAIFRAALGRLTGGLSPPAIASAYADWATHLAASFSKRAELSQKAFRKLGRLQLFATQSLFSECSPCIEPLAQDRRFDHPGWRLWPFNLYSQSFLLLQQWCWNATTGVRGVTRHHEEVVTFMTRQMLDTISPSNFVATNPEVLQATLGTWGVNLSQGTLNACEDALRALANLPSRGMAAYRVGINMAVTPGKVVYRNRLIELIQYQPQTASVFSQPIFVVPSWIMKYYILDLSPNNSLIRYLVEKGHTVFAVSWKNPDATDRDLTMADYFRYGIVDPCEVIAKIVPSQKLHGVGYCLGGTLLAIAAAAFARDDLKRFETLTLLASELDFSEPGELGLFIDESQIAYLEDIMWDQGYLDAKQMVGAFTFLNSRDLVWSKLTHEYLMGIRREPNDIMAWNADATRMPYRMHSEYLRRLYLNNELASGRYPVDGRPVALSDIRVPIFAVSTERDHISPWRSVYKIHLLTETNITFLLTTGGHNVGVVNPPPGDHFAFRVRHHTPRDKYRDPDDWLESADSNSGSWWPYWQHWLSERSGSREAPPSMGSPVSGVSVICDAPGTYVFES